MYTYYLTRIPMWSICKDYVSQTTQTKTKLFFFFCKKKLKILIIFLYFFYLLPEIFKIFFVFSWHFGGKINLPKVYFLIEFWFVSLLGGIRVQNWCKKETFFFVFAKIRKKMGTMARTRSRINVHLTK